MLWASWMQRYLNNHTLINILKAAELKQEIYKQETELPALNKNYKETK